MKLADYLSSTAKTVAEFAAEVGVDQRNIYRYLSGSRVPRPEIAARIRRVTNGQVTLNDFVPEADESQSPAAA